MFEKARLKLTAWYLSIIMAISVIFSLIIYSGINSELRHFEKMQIRLHEDIAVRISPYRRAVFVSPDPGIIQAARARLIFSLVLINLCILVLAGGAGYFLAGRTLRPIKKMVDEQKRFITDASHELRTPLTSLRSEIEVALRQKTVTTREAKKLLGSNLEEVISLQTLSDNLLELAQNGKQADPKHLQKLSSADLIDSAIKKVEPLARKKQITIKKHITDITLVGIEERLLQVFVILLDNAIKYAPSKSDVEITIKKSTNKVRIAITNAGVGIAKKDLPHIFDRFYRGDTSRSKTSGYGLGLSIAKKIVESHRGTIVVTSIPQKKTTFSIFLPSA